MFPQLPSELQQPTATSPYDTVATSKVLTGIEAALWLLRFCGLILTAGVRRYSASFKARSTCEFRIRPLVLGDERNVPPGIPYTMRKFTAVSHCNIANKFYSLKSKQVKVSRREFNIKLPVSFVLSTSGSKCVTASAAATQISHISHTN